MDLKADLREVRDKLSDFSEWFDADLLNVEGAVWVTQEATAVANMALAIARAASSRAAKGAAEQEGDKDPASWVGRKTGKSKSKAKTDMDTEERLKELPEVREAAARGELSPEQTAAIADAASADPDAQGALLDTARTQPLAKLQEHCRRVKAAADPDPEGTYKRLHEARRLIMWGDAEGGFRLMMNHVPDAGVVVREVIEEITDELCAKARAEGRRDTREQLAADAMVLLCERYMAAYRYGGIRNPTEPTTTGGTGADDGDHDTPAAPARPSPTPQPSSGGGGVLFEEPVPPPAPQAAAQPEPAAPAPVPRRRARGRGSKYLGILRLDVTALQRGRAEPGEVVEIAGVGPVPVSVALDLMGDAVLKLVITDGIDVLNVTHLGRAPTVAQEVAMLWRQRWCTALVCPSPATEWDHREPWADTHITRLDGLDGYCDHHHLLKTHHGWALVNGKGPREMVPPDDPRHPRWAAQQAG